MIPFDYFNQFSAKSQKIFIIKFSSKCKQRQIILKGKISNLIPKVGQWTFVSSLENKNTRKLQDVFLIVIKNLDTSNLKKKKKNKLGLSWAKLSLCWGYGLIEIGW